ncbi:hypothetical protein FA13DRAFT_1762697 [Coprinellus micaceus]|uniref:CID domain-containing protein n=1 Tax=Coprinellus micaceus TaxID=71717 RepID=A0A4Y7TNV6_COPMI|nr:hypothetical protein FA13DRAFT_1762697 [Coprinellus micaceus]
MYSQATPGVYGRSSYGHPFPPPPVNSYHGYYQQQYPQQPPPHYPPQPPVYTVDPNTFRRDYMGSLSELTFNSRPIIQNLSNIAADNHRYADIVVSCIDDHIRRLPFPRSICSTRFPKNVFDPYARRFSSVVTNLFLDTYRQVDPQTRTKMEEMLLTWRNGSPTRSQLFGSVNQIAIERGVWGDGSESSITQGQVLSELQFAIDAKKRALQVNPYDTDAQRKTEVLHQLRKCILEAGVSQSELRQILNQLRELVKAPSIPQAAPAPPPSAWRAPAYSPPPPPPQPTLVPPFPPNATSFPINSFPNPSQPAAAPPPQASTSATVDAARLSSIISSLVSAGVVSKTGNATPPTAREPVAAPASPVANVAEDAAWKDYRNAILAQQSKLSSVEILRIEPAIKTLLYTRLPSQCKQCGLRFSDSPRGKRQHQEHLDTHFKRNRKAAQSTGRGHSRHSFQVTEDWIRDVDGTVDDEGKGPDTSIPSNEKNNIQSDAELRSSFVVVPPGDEAKPISCPICKERIKTEFSEEDEEWVWRNAILKDDKIYHATCHAEALSSTNTLAARLRSDLISSSRGGTPEVNGSSRSTPPPSALRKSLSPPRSPDSKVGTKRKVEDMDSELTGNRTGTPPSKKVAMSGSS